METSAVNCPICRTVSNQKFGISPYYICPNCDCWFQHPMPPKTYIAAFEGDPNQMSDADKKVNQNLAYHLFSDPSKMGLVPGPTLDIGSKYPYLASQLKWYGCAAEACDHEVVNDSLGVVTHVLDFERDEWPSPTHYKLITLIHTFEHLYDPLRAIAKLRGMIADDGTLFIRSPNHAVPGFERDLTEGHYSIHPFYHSTTSILQCLLEVQDCFWITESSHANGFGQTDWTLKPIKKKPTICLAMIAKNEGRDLPKTLAAAKPAVDCMSLIDTGSTDYTIKIAATTIPEGKFQVYTGASELVDGDWKLMDFSKARNRALDNADDLADWVLCLDADDELKTPLAVRRASYYRQFHSLALKIQDTGMAWLTHRMWQTKLGIRFKGRCHEYPELTKGPSAEVSDSLIVHNSAPEASQENANARNLRILTEQWKDHPDARCAFYIGTTHRDGGRWKEAIHWFSRRLEFGHEFRDEYLFARLYMIRAYSMTEDWHSALAQAIIGVNEAPEWAEFRMEKARLEHIMEKDIEAIETAKPCLTMSIPPTPLWREHNAYSDQPARLISYCYESLGDKALALAWSLVAAEKINSVDPSWSARVGKLRDELIAA